MGEVAAGVKVAEAVDDVWGEVEDFAHLTHGAAAAVGDDVGGHGGAVGGEAAIDFLDDALALGAGGEVEVDVWPSVAAFAEEALKEEAAGDGIDVGDGEAVADGAVGGAAAALHEDAVFSSPADDVPDDEEVAAEAEFFDEAQLVIELLADGGGDGLVTLAGALVGELAEVAVLVVIGWDGVGGEGVAEVFQGEIDGVQQALGVGESCGEIREKGLHLAGGLEAALGIGGEDEAGCIEMGVVAEAGEGVVDDAAFFVGVEGGVGGE